VVRAQSRKIIFSTNLPNIGDLDDALIRPGRCFARLTIRELDVSETRNLLAKLGAEQPRRASSVMAALSSGAQNTYSLAEIYQAFARTA